MKQQGVASFLRQANNRRKFNIFLFLKLPAAYICGVRLRESDGTTGSGHGSISVDISESLQVDLFCLSGDGGGAQYGHSRHGISQWAEAQGFDARRKHGG